MKEFEITPNEAGQRFDKYLGKLLSGSSMGFIYKMLRKKNFTLNGKKAAGNEILTVGDHVKLFLSDETFEKFSVPETGTTDSRIALYSKADLAALHLEIVYEDAHILVWNKPAGMLSQKSVEADHSVNEYLIGYLLYQQELTPADLKTFRPSIANRLDRNTSGLILCGKSLAGLQYLSKIIKDRTLEKYYRCIVSGRLRGQQWIEGYLTKDASKNKVQILSEPSPDTEASYIKTGLCPIAAYQWRQAYYTELSVHLITGKPHQIRAHLSDIGHPIAGDYKYGWDKKNVLTQKYHVKSQLLHASRMVFPETEGTFAYLSGKELIAKVPPIYEKVLKELQNGNME
jgi:23S rRNA pseudouridine955/2504/2580 synthase